MNYPLIFVFQRDKTREHCITKFITSTIQRNKPEDVDFADWIQDGIILTK